MSCSGNSAAFFSGSELFERKSYTTTNLEKLGFSNDSASSIAIPYGYAVDLFDHNGFSSDPFTIEGPFYDDETLRHACISLFDNFNDRTSSLEVYKTAQLGSAKGYWRSITQTETLNFTVRYGVHSKRVENTTTTQELALSFEMSAGIDFLGTDFGGKIGTEYSLEIKKDIE